MKKQNEYFIRKVGFWETLPVDTFWFEELNEKKRKVETKILIRSSDGTIMKRNDITQVLMDTYGIETPMVSLREHKWAITFWIVVAAIVVIFIGHWIVEFFQWLF
jgi:hypothetical protein